MLPVPLILLGALALGAAFTRKKQRTNDTTISAMVDPAERYNPNAAIVSNYLTAAVASNSISKLTETANLIERSYGMPKTANVLRAWLAQMQQNAGLGGTPLVAGEDEEIGARAYGYPRSRRANKVPDWLRFHATQSKLSGDPSQIRATARAMEMAGYRTAARVHIQQLQRLGKSPPPEYGE